MPSGFTTLPLTIGRLFSAPYLFSAPSFQRTYSWTVNEAGQLLEDLLASLGDDDEATSAPCGYFLGSVLLMQAESGSRLAGWVRSKRKAERGAAARRHGIVDGLQRLTTLMLLFAALCDLDSEDGSDLLARRISPHLQDPDSGELRLTLRGAEGPLLAAFAKGDGEAVLEARGDGAADTPLLEVYRVLRDELEGIDGERRRQLADYILMECQVVVIVVPTIDRAHRIFSILNERGKPLARHDVLKADILGAIASEDQDRYLSMWDGLCADLGDDFETLFSHIRSIHGRVRSPIISEIREVVADAGGGAAFIDNIVAPLTPIYRNILQASSGGSTHDREIRRSLTYLGWLSGADWVPPAMQWMLLNGDAPDRIASFLDQLERYSFCLRVIGLGAAKRELRYQKVLRAIHDGTVRDNDWAVMTITREEQRHLLYNLRNLHSRSNQVCKLVLLRLSDELAGGLEGLAPSQLTVEHVLPRKPARVSQWRDWFPEPDERDICTNGLGNLVLISKKQNAAAANGELESKLQTYFSAGDQPVARLTEDLRGLKHWGPEQVRERERRMLEVITSLWRIDLPGNHAAGAIASVDAALPPA